VKPVAAALLAALATFTTSGGAAPANAQRFEGVRFESVTASDPSTQLAGMGRSEPEWLAWTVEALPDAADLCCFSGRGYNRVCKLAGGDNGWGTMRDDSYRRPPSERVPLIVLAEIERGRVRRMKMIGERCAIEGGNRRVVLVEGVDAASSLDLLERLAMGTPASRSDEDVAETAIAAMSYHAEGVPRMVRLLRSSRERDVQRQLLFWLASSDDPRGLAELERILIR
jgi:hypothetical protein